ncbi:MAG TPA: hypothetical protein VG389_28415 [Myxococcota bacterium]|jgi:Tol biopolymer transport system component|nr:hypothetical protein [Myxococcota bacterium]
MEQHARGVSSWPQRLWLVPFVLLLLLLAASGGCRCGGDVGDPCDAQDDCRAGLVCDPQTRTCRKPPGATDAGGADAASDSAAAGADAGDAAPGADSAIFTIDAGGSDAAPGTDAGPACSGPFGAPTDVMELDTADFEYEPTLLPDALTIFFAAVRPGGMGFLDIWTATRADATSTFGTPVPAAGVNSVEDDRAPSISADGLTIYFSSTRTGGLGSFDIWQATRAGISDPFSPPTPVAGVNSADSDAFPNLSYDGLTLYFASPRTGGAGNQDLYSATRASVAAPFGLPANMTSLNTFDGEFAPSVSADGLTLYFVSDRPGGLGSYDIWAATRADTAGTFGSPVPVSGVNDVGVDSTPALTFDGTTLFFASDRPGSLGAVDLWMAQRACP